MSIKSLINNLYKKTIKIHRKICVNHSNINHFKLLKKKNIPIKKLSSEQKKLIDNIYKKYGYSYSYKTHQLCYSINNKFDEYIMPEDLFRQIELELNDINYKSFFTDKSYFDLFMPNVKFPDTIIKNINGTYYNSNNNILSISDVSKLINSYEKLVVKPSIDSGFGKSVRLLNNDELIKIIKDKSIGKNFLIQKVLKQDKILSTLNESSVNIIRIVTLFLNDKVYPVSAAIRIGANNSFTDNYISSDGKGMIVVGIDKNGKIKENGYYSSVEKTNVTSNGIKFGGITIPKYNELLKIAVDNAMRFPNIRFIGWDFTIDYSGNVVVMEYNAKSPGILYYQYCNGALFGNLTEKLLKSIKNEDGK